MSDEISSADMEKLIDSEIDRLVDVQLRKKRRETFLQQYEYVQKLGSGGEGDVSLMRHRSGTAYAVKKIKQRYLYSTTSASYTTPIAHNEVRILSLLTNVGSGHGQNTICHPASQNEAWYPATPSPDTQVLVMEYCELGSLRDYLMRDCNDLSVRAWRTPHEYVLRHIYAQLLAGVAFLHHGYGTTAFDGPKKPPKGRNPIIHRDLKPQNVLVCPAAPGDHPSLVQVKLADFGGAAEVKSSPRTEDDDNKLYFFTEGYYAPEFLKMDRHMADQSNDVFATGATVYYCVWRTQPYFHNEDGWPQFRRKECTNKKHRGGQNFTAEFNASIGSAVTISRHRKDALSILGKLKKTEAAHRQEYMDWMTNVEELWRDMQRRKIEERKRRKEEARAQAFKQELRLQCFDPLCSYNLTDGFLPHKHLCELEGCPLAETPGHGHWLLRVEHTWADPRNYLPRQLNEAPQELIDETMRCIQLSVQDYLEGRSEAEAKLHLGSLTVLSEVENGDRAGSGDLNFW
ncbi:hypothetical protein BFW01_g2830 [Lasiodiplodia theobromae]|nr:hypothetical protein BFW01_g2830 [Lasiodiplodia theobromae]